MKQGQSYATEDKERGFLSVFSTNLKIAQNAFKKLDFACRYFHFDLHGGSGFNDEVGVTGSPLIFRDTAIAECVPFRMHVAEIDRRRAQQLSKRLTNCEQSYVHTGDNKELVEMIPSLIQDAGESPQFAIGSILLDPNGADGIPWSSLEQITSVCKRIDVILNYNSFVMKFLRINGSRKFASLYDLPGILKKNHWLIRGPLGMHRFFTVVGRNYPVGGHRAIGLHEWASPEGKARLAEAMMTKHERKLRCERLQRVLKGLDGT